MIDPELQARTIGKIRARIIPFIFVLYVVAFLDRINIGFAALTMNKELALRASSLGCWRGFSFLGIAFLRCRAICCCTRLGRGSGLRGFC